MAAGRELLVKGTRLIVTGVRDEKRMFFTSLAGAASVAVLTVVSAWVVGGVVANVVVPSLRNGRIDTTALTVSVIVLVVLSEIKMLGIFARRLGSALLQLRVQARYRRRLTRRYLELPLSWHQAHPTGELLANSSSDVETSSLPTGTVTYAMATMILLLTALISLFVTDWALGMVGLVFFPTLFGIYTIYSRRVAPRYANVQALRSQVATIAHESFDGALVVKSMGRENQETERFAEKVYALRDAQIGVGRIRGVFDPIIDAIPSMGTLAVLLVGSMRLAAGDIGVSGLVGAAFLFALMEAPVRAIGWFLTALPSAVVAFERVQRVLGAPGEMVYGTRTIKAKRRSGGARLDFENVTFSYEPGNRTLRKVSFSVPAGAVVALVGPTGSGKSTIASLAARLLDPDKGGVRLDGKKLTGLTAASIAANIGFVPQVPFVFNDTVRGNVGLDREGVGDKQIWNALRAAQAEGFVGRMADGLDTELGERGTSVSGGQRQRLTLARALAGRPRLLILDDATSAVDPKVEAAMLRDLRAQASGDAGQTILVIAHRPATIAIADQVIYLESGQVVATGTHSDLLRRAPGYADLVTAYEREEAERALAREYADDDLAGVSA